MASRAETALSLPVAFRAAFQELRADYAAGSTSRFRPRLSGVQVTGSGADYHYRDENKFFGMMERSRYFDRNNMIIGQAVDRVCDNIVQDGFTLDTQTGDDGLDDELKTRFWDWALDADQCDQEGEKTFPDFEWLNLRHIIVDGDVLNFPLIDGTLQAYEGHRLKTPHRTRRNIVHGVGLTDTGKRKEYYVTREDLDPRAAVPLKDFLQPIARTGKDGTRQVLHQYHPKRFSQRRGVTAFAPCVDAVGMHDDIQFAHLVKVQVNSCFAIFEELAAEAPSLPNNRPVRTGQETTVDLPDGSERTIGGLSPGMRVRGAPGVKMHGFSPNVPNAEFFPHTTLILTFIAVNLGIPVQMLLLDPTKSNFSSWRGAIDQARMGFRRIQKARISQFNRPVYEWKVRQFAADDPALRKRLDERKGSGKVNPLRHEWQPPRWRYIQPLEDANADVVRDRNALTSMRRICAERGEDVDEIRVERISDKKADYIAAVEAAEELNRKFPQLKEHERFSWLHFTPARVPEGMTVSISQDTQPAPKPAAKQQEETE